MQKSEISGTVQPLQHQNDRSKFDHNISQCFRKPGVADDPKETKAENLLPRTLKVKEMLNFIGEKSNIVELERLCMSDVTRLKLRSLLITLSSDHEARLVLAKAKEKRVALSEMGIYLLEALSEDDAIKEILILKKRRALLSEEVAREKLGSEISN